MPNIILTREGLSDQLIRQQVWPLKVTATLASGSIMPSAKIFVYHASMEDDAYEGDLFECVASVQQYIDIPEDAAILLEDDLVVPYYRSNIINFSCRSPDELDSLWADIQEDVTDLVNNYEALNGLTNIESVEI